MITYHIYRCDTSYDNSAMIQERMYTTTLANVSDTCKL